MAGRKMAAMTETFAGIKAAWPTLALDQQRSRIADFIARGPNLRSPGPYAFVRNAILEMRPPGTPFSNALARETNAYGKLPPVFTIYRHASASETVPGLCWTLYASNTRSARGGHLQSVPSVRPEDIDGIVCADDREIIVYLVEDANRIQSRIVPRT
jgi:hypothetical protein